MRVLVATLGSLGDLHPFLALALELKRRGHGVVVAAPELYRALIEANDLEHRALRPDEVPRRYETSGILEAGRGFKTVLQWFRKQISNTFDDLCSIADDVEVLVSSDRVLPSPLFAAQRRIPWFYAAQTPPISLTAALPDELRYLCTGSSPRAAEAENTKIAAAALLTLCRTRAIPLSALRTKPDLRLYLFPDWFTGALADWPPRGSAATGFCFFKGDAHQLPPVLQTFLRAGERPIVFTMGSTVAHGISRAFYDTAAVVVKELRSRAVFLTGSDRIAGFDDAQPTAAVVTAAYAPHRLLFPEARLVVHHGGIGTIAEALRAGVPQLAIPFAFDQPHTAVLTRDLGVAGVLAPRLYEAGTLKRAISPLLQDARYAQCAQLYAARVATGDGAKAACDLIEARSKARPAQSRPRLDS